jgi:hypothetical protein
MILVAVAKVAVVAVRAAVVAAVARVAALAAPAVAAVVVRLLAGRIVRQEADRRRIRRRAEVLTKA